MNIRHLCILILVLVIGCQGVGMGADKAVMPASDTSTETTLDTHETQLEINKDTLLKGSSEQIRIYAATQLLFDEDVQARKILLDALSQSENTAAQAAVCRALSQARASQKLIKNKKDFIQPLLNILTTDDSAGTKFAAEATLIFDYERILEPIEKIAMDTSLPAKARLNAVYVLKIQPDKRAVIKLIELAGDSEKQVASAAEDALQSLGVTAGKDPKSRKEAIDELKQKDVETFLRNRLLLKAEQMRRCENERDFWQKQYQAALDRIYDDIKDDLGKAKFLEENLGSPQAGIKLWVLKKVSEWRQSTKPELPVDLGFVLVNLVSDQDRDVRLKTATLLPLMGGINSAQKLLEQRKVEQDEEVKLELFVALGWACYYASLPDSKFSIPAEIKKQTLAWAAEYLSEQDTKEVQSGAEVIRKLLEHDGLTSEEVDKYLGRLEQTYKQQKNNVDGTLRGALLNAMAGLCTQGSVYKDKAEKLFDPLFEEALHDETDPVREAAVEGIINIDKTKALGTLKKDFINDSSPVIRKRLIDLAGEFGGKDDLGWLWEKVNSTEGEPVWQTMLRIFKNSDIATLKKWTTEFESQNSEARLSDERFISFLETAERKVVSENDSKMVKNIRRKLADLYNKTSKFEQAAERLWKMRQDAQTSEEKDAILGELLELHFSKWLNAEAAASLVKTCLIEKDIGPNSVVIRSVDKYFREQRSGGDPNAMLKALSQINIPDARPKWQEYIGHLTKVNKK